jgi:hypothetical protein
MHRPVAGDDASAATHGGDGEAAHAGAVPVGGEARVSDGGCGPHVVGGWTAGLAISWGV